MIEAGRPRRALALLVAGAFFMEIVDGTVIAPAAPHIAADFGVGPVAINVAITGYVLTLGVLIPISGWVADRLGVRRVFCAALVVFTLASVGCALAPTLGWLVAARVLQGAGGALLVPVGRLAVLRTTAKTDLVRAIAYLTWPALVAPVIAPALGGVLAEYASWRWIFVINVPLGIAALAVALRVVPDLRSQRRVPLDRGGFALVAAGVAALVVGLESLGGTEPAWVAAGVGGGVAVVSLSCAVRHLLRTADPLVDLRVLRVATFRITAFTGSVYRAIIAAIPFLLPLFFQIGFGWTAAQAGLAVIALFVGNVGIKPATTPLMRRWGIRTTLIVAIAVGAACLLAMASLRPATPLPVLLGVLLVSGVVRSVGFTAYNSVAFADVEPARMSHANTLMSTLQELGAGLGVAVGALLVRLGAATGAGERPDGPYRVAFVVLAVLLAGPLIAALRLSRTAGDVVTGRA
jgi:EmrB/QacA subfamily drug resistance transporter